MSAKQVISGLVVIVLVAGVLAGEALSFGRGRGGARGRAGTGSARSLGTPTLAPRQHEFTSPNRRDTVSSPFDGRQFSDRTNPLRPESSVLDHLGIEAPSESPRLGAFNGGNLSASRHQPFTPAWYAEHPNAWQMTHPHADAAVVATSAAVVAWLGVGHATVSSTTTTVIETSSGPLDETSDDPSDGEQASTPPNTPPTVDDGEWMPLGSFDLKLTGQTVATRAIQLAVNHQSVIRGTYYDMAADSVKEVTGAVDKKTLRASWTIGQSGLVVYEISVDALSSPEGELTVRYANGQTATWQMSPISQ